MNNNKQLIIKKAPKVNLIKKYINTSKIEEVAIDNKEGCFKFTTKFAHLGSTVKFLTSNTEDAKY